METTNSNKKITMRHRGRSSQIIIYLGKIFRIFLYQNDWKVLPMSAVVAGMAALVVRGGMFQSMERTLTGSLALTCVAIWNGFFNSIQVVCRERSIIKREHRAGMHVSAYIAAHMIFQAMLCAIQTGILLYVCSMMGIIFPWKGLITDLFLVDLWITLFLVTYASDMMSLLISSIVRTTTAAMTVMPFLLIFQLVFSGGVFHLPKSVEFMSEYTFSHYGLTCIAAQAGYNELPMVSAWQTLDQMKDSEIEAEVTVDQTMDVLMNNPNESLQKIRDAEVEEGTTVLDIMEMIREAPDYPLYANEIIPIRFKISDVIEVLGQDRVKSAVYEKSREAGQNQEYRKTSENVLGCWFTLAFMAFLMAFLAVIALEFIDQDKR